MNESKFGKERFSFYLEKFCLDGFHTGSREICDTPPDTDDDYILLLIPENLQKIEEFLHSKGWVRGGSFHEKLSETPYEGDTVNEDTVFSSWKYNITIVDNETKVINFLLTVSPEYFMNFRLATALCKKLNLTEKADRVTVFQSICLDNFPLEVLN